MKLNLIRNLTLYIGGALIALTGLTYVLLTDLYLGNESKYLLVGIILAFAAAACFLLADSFKSKLKLFYTLKSIGIVMSIVFIVYLFIFMSVQSSDKLYTYLNKPTHLKLFRRDEEKIVSFLSRSFNNAAKIECNIKPLYIVNIVLSFIVVAIQGSNITLNIILGVEE